LLSYSYFGPEECCDTIVWYLQLMADLDFPATSNVNTPTPLFF
jgi:hypothetical protein